MTGGHSRSRSFRRKKKPNVDDLECSTPSGGICNLREPDNGSTSADEPEKKGFMKKLRGMFNKARYKPKRGSAGDDPHPDDGHSWSTSATSKPVEDGDPGFVHSRAERCPSRMEDIPCAPGSFDRHRRVRQTAPGRIHTHIPMPRNVTTATLHTSQTSDSTRTSSHPDAPGRCGEGGRGDGGRGVQARDHALPRPQHTPAPPPLRPSASLPPTERRRRRRRPSEASCTAQADERPHIYGATNINTNNENKNQQKVNAVLSPPATKSTEVTGAIQNPVIHYHLTLHNCDGVEINCANGDSRCSTNIRPRITCGAANDRLKRLSWVELPPCEIPVETEMVPTEQADPGPLASEGEFYLSEEGQRLLGSQDHVILATSDVLHSTNERASEAGSMDTLRLLRTSPYDGLPVENIDVGSMDTLRLLSATPSQVPPDNNGDLSLTENHLALSNSLAAWQIEQLDLDEACTMHRHSAPETGMWNSGKSQGKSTYTRTSRSPASTDLTVNVRDPGQPTVSTCDQSVQVESPANCHCGSSNEPLVGRTDKAIPIQRVTPCIRKIEIRNPPAAVTTSASHAPSTSSHSHPPRTTLATTPTTTPTVNPSSATSSFSQQRDSSDPQLTSFHTQTAALDAMLRLRLERILDNVRAENIPHQSSGHRGNFRRGLSNESRTSSRVNAISNRPLTSHHRDMSLNEKLASVRESLIRMPGVLILGVRRGKIVVTLSPERRDTRDISRFMQEHHIHGGEYECGVLARRFQAHRHRNWRGHTSCVVR